MQEICPILSSKIGHVLAKATLDALEKGFVAFHAFDLENQNILCISTLQIKRYCA